MKFEKITDNKIRIIVCSSELESKKLDSNLLKSHYIENHNFINKLLEKARLQLGFETKGCRLLLENSYADDDYLQYLHRGNETVEWMPLDEIQDASEYSEEADFLGTSTVGKTKVSLDFDEGSFAYFAPCDVHRPGMFREADKVKKIVFKIPVKE